MDRYSSGILVAALVAWVGYASAGCSSSSSTDTRSDVADNAGDPGAQDTAAEEVGAADPGLDPGTDPGGDPGTETAGDPGSDPGTDPGTSAPYTLTFKGSGFSPHNGQLFKVALIDAGTGTTVATDSTTIAGGTFSFTFTGKLEAGAAYHLDYFADFSGNGTCDAPPTDHGWRTEIPAVAADVEVDVVHNTDFYADVCASFP